MGCAMRSTRRSEAYAGLVALGLFAATVSLLAGFAFVVDAEQLGDEFSRSTNSIDVAIRNNGEAQH